MIDESIIKHSFYICEWVGTLFCFWASLRSTLHMIMDFAQRKEKSTSTNFEVFVRTTSQELLSSNASAVMKSGA